ncbi:cation efflux family-domain-containing protein [Mycotypha africana]|uniref:cation efflux family-domain-containing protein n=1 Tax=Mycotypha africana TaxID=64632 RepID=UPI0023012BA6|nr:cation efflux family-domain-containing protein [Mycotypha africana]KAI8970269.1 cation efflux family-domain-containing protein [Mycotypha africana]
MKFTFSREARIYFMLVITTAFFFVEIVIGYYVSSLALIADSFHMLNDLISMCIALWAIKVAKKTQYNPKYSYGWQRAEILGALVNGVFLLALCFTILIDSIERFISPEDVHNPKLVLITGCAGLGANLLGLVLFHEHGHGGHSHGHSHGQSKHEHRSQPYKTNDVESLHTGHYEDKLEDDTQPSGGGHLNMKGIFLHVMGDALGNVAVIASALFIWLTDFSWRFYADPLVSTLITCVIFMSALPLVKQTSVILLQGVPQSVHLGEVYEALQKLEGIISIHELHIWQLNDIKLIATLHVLLSSRQEYMKLGFKIRSVFHTYGIHSVTIQPEFVEDTALQVTPYVDEKCNYTAENKADTTQQNNIYDGLRSSTMIAASNSQMKSSATSSISSSSAPTNDGNLTNQQAAPSSLEDLNHNNSSVCLLRCTEESCQSNACCPPDHLQQLQNSLSQH